jgi:hypothetical protein
MEKNFKNIVEETDVLLDEFFSLYKRYSNYQNIIVPKETFLEFHNKIIEKGNAILLVMYDIVLKRNIDHEFDEDYYNLLNNDLSTLIDFIIKYMDPFINVMNDVITNNNYMKLCYKSYKKKTFDNEVLDNLNTFQNNLGYLLCKNGLLDELYYLFAPGEISEQFTTSLYKRLSSFELAVAYYANCKYYERDDENGLSLCTFEGNEKTDRIFVELGNRTTEELFDYIYSLIKLPCNGAIGIIGAFVHLSKRLDHEKLTTFIYGLRYHEDFKNIDEIELDILYSCLEDAEGVAKNITSIEDFANKGESLKKKISDCTNNKYRL